MCAQEVLNFCFPPGVEHPKAAARLFLLCECVTCLQNAPAPLAAAGEQPAVPLRLMQRALLRLGASHPRRAPRYGPLVDGWLWGGAYNARRKLSEYEIETMVTKLEREDIINAVKPEEHGRSAMLPPTPEQENEVLAGVPESMKKPYRLRRPDIVAMLAPCATPPEVRTLCPLPLNAANRN